MKREYKEILVRLNSAFGETWALDSWIGKENEAKAVSLANRFDKAMYPSKKAIREGAVSHLIDLTDEEESLLDLIIEKGVSASAIARKNAFN